MKALRKSLNRDPYASHAHISNPLPAVSKPAPSVVPPQKVIRASAPYRSAAPQELSFQKGDFFYVVRELDDHGAWYEAHNPMTGARGIVPRAMFEEFNKGAAPGNARASQAVSLAHAISSPISSPPASRASHVGRTQTFYAVVIHDFRAERTDELDAKAGDALTVVAQSNREWFVAKPISRLGKPGLIPVSFVEMRDPHTNEAIEDVDAIMDNGSLPRVEDWKRQVMNYKATSIPLGTLDDQSALVPQQGNAYPPSSPQLLQQAQVRNTLSGPPSEPSGSPPAVEAAPRRGPPRSDSLALSSLPDGLLLSANVTAYHFENEDYWFRIQATYQPFDAAGTTSLPPSRDLTLFRAYNDFFDFQTTLLQLFPAEGGQSPAARRILPYMPGPAERVDSELSARRREELDEYVVRLCRLNRTTARYVLEHPHVREFFAARPGDLDKGAGPQFEVMSALNWYDPVEEPEVMAATPDGVSGEEEEGLNERFRAASVADSRGSDGSDYGEETVARYGQGNGHQHHLRVAHAHSASTSSRTPSPRGHAAKASVHSVYASGRDSAYSSGSSSSRLHSHSTHATSPTSSTSASARSKPPISAANPTPAFVKIKVFDRVQEDLIALRVHPRGTLAELLDKVQQRLGAGVSTLSYRAGGPGGEDYVALRDDAELEAWIEGADRHVLHAD